jgi:hypothetical protein
MLVSQHYLIITQQVTHHIPTAYQQHLLMNNMVGAVSRSRPSTWRPMSLGVTASEFESLHWHVTRPSMASAGFLLGSSTLTMEALYSSEMSGCLRTTARYNPEDRRLHFPLLYFFLIVCFSSCLLCKPESTFELAGVAHDHILCVFISISRYDRTSFSSGKRCCFVFRWLSAGLFVLNPAIITEIVRGLPYSRQVDSGILPQIRPRPLPYPSQFIIRISRTTFNAP